MADQTILPSRAILARLLFCALQPILQPAVSLSQSAGEAETPLAHKEIIRNLPIPIRAHAEFDRLSAVMLAANGMVHQTPELFAELVGNISERAPVIAIVSGPEQILNGREALEAANIDRSRVNFVIYPLDSLWIRDYGPFFVRRSDGSGVTLDFFYNTGGSLSDRAADDAFPWIFANFLNVSISYVPLMLEGGNFQTNGRGLAVTSRAFIERNKFRGLSQEELQRILANYLCLKDFTTVPSLPGERTGHVDMFMTFVNTRTVIVAQADPKYHSKETIEALEQTADKLGSFDFEGAPIQVHRIPLPPKKGSNWRSFTNIIYVNGLVLLPSYSDVDPSLEREAIETFQRLMPKWEVRSILADPLVEVGGFLHCLSLGIPHFIDPFPLLEL